MRSMLRSTAAVGSMSTVEVSTENFELPVRRSGISHFTSSWRCTTRNEANRRKGTKGGQCKEPRERQRGVAAGIDLRLVPLPCLYYDCM